MSTVIFACVHNAGRSQMAAAWFNALADSTKARAISAGTEPGARVHPEVLAAMREVAIDLSAAVPQRLTDDLARGARMLVTMGCGEACPVVPGVKREDWPLEDPKGKPLARVREIREEIRGHVVALLEREQWQRQVRGAREGDREAIEGLLRAAKLPTEGVAEHVASFFVAEEGQRVAAVGGIEPYGDVGLLRSVVVAGDARGRGLGQAMTRRVLEEARARSMRAVFLLTTTAEAFFPRFGFEPIPRSDVPEALQASREFQGACPASAIVMRLALPGER